MVQLAFWKGLLVLREIAFHARSRRDSKVYVPPEIRRAPLAGVTHAEYFLMSMSCFIDPCVRWTQYNVYRDWTENHRVLYCPRFFHCTLHHSWIMNNTCNPTYYWNWNNGYHFWLQASWAIPSALALDHALAKITDTCTSTIWKQHPTVSRAESCQHKNEYEPPPHCAFNSNPSLKPPLLTATVAAIVQGESQATGACPWSTHEFTQAPLIPAYRNSGCN